MRIAYFSDTFYPQINGVSNTLSHLRKHLDKNKIEYTFFVPEYEDDAFKTDARVSSSKSIPFPLYSQCKLALPWLPRLTRIMDDFKPDLIHLVTEFGIGLMGRTYAKSRPVQIVSSYHTNIDHYMSYYSSLGLLKSGIEEYYRWFHSASRRVFVPTEDTMGKLHTMGLPDLSIWSRGIDTSLFSPSKRSADFKAKYGLEDKTVLLYVGRVSTEKDLDILPEAMRMISSEHEKKTALVITGDGPYLSTLKKEAPEGTIFTGFLRGESLAEAYASSDIFVTPSSTETFGNVALEAMASGLPVIAADAGGFKHVVRQGVDGFRCSPRNAGDFAKAMSTLIDYPDIARQMGDAALVNAAKRSWDSVFDKLMADYEDVFALQRRVS